MKKLNILLLSVILTITLVGCGLFSDDESSATPTPIPTSTPESSDEENSDNESSEDESSDEESFDNESSEDESSDEESSGEDSSSDESDMSGTDDINMNFKDLSDEMKEVYGEDYMPDTELSDAEIEEKLGLSSDMYDDIYAHTKEGSPDIFVAVKAKSGTAGDVERALSSYKDELAADENYSDKKDKINSAQVHVDGDYVFLVLLGSDAPANDDYKAEIDKGLETIKKRFEM